MDDRQSELIIHCLNRWMIVCCVHAVAWSVLRGQRQRLLRAQVRLPGGGFLRRELPDLRPVHQQAHRQVQERQTLLC